MRSLKLTMETQTTTSYTRHLMVPTRRISVVSSMMGTPRKKRTQRRRRRTRKNMTPGRRSSQAVIKAERRTEVR
jgi:hypothetical protein